MSARPTERSTVARADGSRRRWLVQLLTLGCVLPSILSGTAPWWWVGDLFTHFRMPYAVALTVMAAVCIRGRHWRCLLVAGMVLAVNLYLLSPLYKRPQTAAATGEPLRMMVANVFIGNQHPQPILDLVHEENPDLLLLLEVDDRWLKDLAELESAYPHRLVAIRDEGFAGFDPFGIALYSRLPFKQGETPRLGSARIPATRAVIEHDGQTWTIIGAHPYPPISADCSEARNSLLRDVADLAAAATGPTVVFGDLNVTRWSPHFVDLARNGGLRDSSAGFGYQPTWPDTAIGSIIPIDHVLVSPQVRVLDRRVGPSIDSDHLPLIADVATDALE